jgi:hypothetical protein
MYCPTCGLEHLESRRFCNRCGTNLETVSRALTGVLPDPAAAEKLEKRRKAMSRAFLIFCSGPAFGIFMAILAEIFNQLLGYEMSPLGYRVPPPISRVIESLGYFGFLLALIGVIMMINTFIVYGRKKELLQQALQQPQPLPAAQTRQVTQPAPPASVVPLVTPPSVTENTTFRLESQVGLTPGVDTSPTDEERAPRSRQPVKERH